MAEKTGISWCDSTFNPWMGCTKVSIAKTGGGGCDHCYAEHETPVRVHRSKGRELWGPGAQRVRTSAANWKQPLKWNTADFRQCQCGWRGIERDARASATGGRVCPTCCACFGRMVPARMRVFCSSLADVFDNEADSQWRADLFDLILKTPNLDWLLLTKRIGNVGNMLPVPFDFEKHYPNVWLGITIVNQHEADRDIPKLLETAAAVRFVSIEPMLGPVNLQLIAVPPDKDQLKRPWNVEGSKFNSLSLHDDDRFHQPPAKLDWVIIGGESGSKARPAHPNWFRSLRDQCAEAGVPFHFKQWGEWAPRDEWSFQRIRKQCAIKFDGSAVSHDDTPQNVGGHRFELVGKKAAGRLLDGQEHNAFARAVS